MSALTRIPFEPVPVRPRHDGWTAERQVRFIEVLAGCKCVDEACRAVGMSDTSAYELRNRSCGEAFRKAWDLALEFQLDRVEQAAVERSIHGVRRPIFYKGEQVGEWRHHDERLTMFLLRSRRALRYGKAAELAPPPPPWSEEANGRRYALADALLNVAIKAPAEHGNPIEDLLSDDEECG